MSQLIKKKPAAAAPAKKQQPARAHAPDAAAAARKPGAGAAAAARRAADSSSDDDDDEDSDEEIGLTASTTQRATMKPITDDAKPAPAAATAKSSKSKPANAAAGQKRKAAADDAGEEESSADEADPNELIDVEFGIYDPRPIDYLTLKALLKDYVPVHATGAAGGKKQKKKAAAAAAAAAAEEDDLDDAPASSSASSPDFPLHELCDTLVSQVCVGSMVKGEGTEEPLGFLSVLNLSWQATKGRHSDSGMPLSWPAQFKKYILQHVPSSHRSTFEAALSSKDLGLLIQNRLLNVPPQIVPQLHQCLLDDLEWSGENGVPPTPASAAAAAASPSAADIAAYRSSFDFKTLLLVGRTFKPPAGSARQAKIDVVPAFVSPFASKKKQKKAAGEAASSAASAAQALPEFEWIRFEEELYAKYSTAQFTFAAPYSQEDAAAGRLPQNVVVMLIPASKHTQIVQELHAMAAMV